MNRLTMRGLALTALCIATAWPSPASAARPAASLTTQGQEEAEAELRLRLRQAERKLRQGDAVGALLDVETVLSRDDRLWEAYYLRGRIQAQMGDDLGARDSLQRAVELDPGNDELHFLVASLALQLADLDNAWRQLVAAAQAGHDRDQVEALARQLEDAGQDTSGLGEALAAPRVVVTVDETPSRGLRDLGIELRTLLLEEPAVGLVKTPAAAAFEVRLTPAGDDAAPTGAIGVVARDLASDRVVLESSLPGTGATARLQLADLVADLVARLGAGGGP